MRLAVDEAVYDLPRMNTSDMEVNRKGFPAGLYSLFAEYRQRFDCDFETIFLRIRLRPVNVNGRRSAAMGERILIEQHNHRKL